MRQGEELARFIKNEIRPGGRLGSPGWLNLRIGLEKNAHRP